MRNDIHLLGVDIGGTKTQLRATGADGAILADRVLPTAAWRSTGNVADAPILAHLLLEICGGMPASVAIGAHGCDDTASCRAFQAALRPLFPGPVTVVNDAELLPPAAGLDRGIGVVAGTGSIAVGRDAARDMIVAGGWGWIIGDEGSASGLVREAVRAIRDAQDRGLPRDLLADAVIESFGVSTELECSRMLAETGGAAALGQHAGAVFAAAAAGSILARRVIQDGARALVELVMRLRARGVADAQVVGGGGVFTGEPQFFSLFVTELADRWPAAEPRRLEGPPVAGAIRIAGQALPLTAVTP